MKKQKLPRGWTQEKIKEVLDYYENQSEEEQVAEHEAAHRSRAYSMIQVPADLVGAVSEFLARLRKRHKKRSGPAKQTSRPKVARS